MVATIPVDPYALAITKDGKTLYGTSSPYAVDASGMPIGTVEVVNTATNTQVGSPISVGSFIGNGNIVVNPTMNRAYMTAYNPVTFTWPGGATGTTYAPSLVVIDTSTNKVVGDPIVLATFGSNGAATTQFSPGPNGALAVSPDGSRVYLAGTTITSVANQPLLQPTLMVFDANTNTQIGSPISLAPASSNVSMAFGGASVLVSPTGDRLYVTLLSTQPSANSSQPTLNSTIYTVDSHSGSTIGNPIVLPDNLAAIMPGTSEVLSPDGTKLYVESLPYSVFISSSQSTQFQSAQQYGNGTVFTYNTATGQQVGAPFDVVGFGAISISKDGKTLYVADVADSRTGKTAVFQTISTVPGQAIYLGSVSAYNLGTGKAVGNPTTVGLYPTSLVINPAGDRLFVANMGDNTISVIDIAGGSDGNLTPIAKIIQTVTAAVQRAAIQVKTVFTTVLNTAVHVQQQVAAQIQQVAKSVQNAAVQAQKQVAAQVQQIVKTVNMVVTTLVQAVTNVVKPPSPPTNVSIKLSAADLLNRINTGVPDGIRIDKVVSSDGTRLVVYMSGVKGGINGLSDNAAVQEMNGIPDPKMSDFINNTVDSLGGRSKIKEIMLVGFSKGGMMAQDYAATGKYGDKVTTIVTFAAPLVKKASEYNAAALHIEAANDYVPRDEGATWFIYVDGGWHMQFSHPDARQSLDGNASDNKSIYIANTGNKYPDNAYHNKSNYLIAANNFTAEVKKNPAKWAAITADINRFAGPIVGPSRTANF